MKRTMLIFFAMMLVLSISCKKNTSQEENRENENFGSHEYVDLGLPSGTLWATCNIGASSPEDYGDYFAWGETTPVQTDYYDSDEYKSIMTKYENKGEDKKILAPEDDAANVNWGNGWKMPTSAQMKELINSEYTETNIISEGNKKGLKVISKQNGKSIFFPAAGYYLFGHLSEIEVAGLYFASDLGEEYCVANVLDFNLIVWHQEPEVRSILRSQPCSIRPVRMK